MASELKIDVTVSGNQVVICERSSGAAIAYLGLDDKEYVVDNLAWTANVFAPNPIDIRAELHNIMTPVECRLVAITPCSHE